MTKKIQRRFLLLAIMLLMTLSLIGSGSRQQAAARVTCQECLDNAENTYNMCLAMPGQTPDYCWARYNQFVSLCYSRGYCATP
jgi:hypothetical protein